MNVEYQSADLQYSLAFGKDNVPFLRLYDLWACDDLPIVEIDQNFRIFDSRKFTDKQHRILNDLQEYFSGCVDEALIWHIAKAFKIVIVKESILECFLTDN